ncbi:MAG: D-glycero-alpha-D-manno-heptose-1,7-bisphosphate 7-phosphatase [Planctomycetales bacterium]
MEPQPPLPTRALFLDRDGVINRGMPRGEYVTCLEQFVLLREVIPVLEAARRLGFSPIVVTNQGQIGKGLIDRATLETIHQQMLALLPGLIDGVYFCPHTAQERCPCRKPLPGMLHQAAQDRQLDLAQSILVGDGDVDIQAGQAAGCRTIFLVTKFRGHELAQVHPDHVVHTHAGIIPLLNS